MSEIILTCQGLSKNYGKKQALHDLTLNLETGRFIGLLGPNGSGKTTFLKIAAGMLSPTSGSIEIAGNPIGKVSKGLVSYLPDCDWLPDEKIHRILASTQDFFPDFDRVKAETMLSDLQIDGNLTPKKLSKGTREKLNLCMAMSRRAKLYLLDEPMAGIDPAARDYILKTILTNYSEDASVILSTHLIGDIENVLDEAIFIKEGTLLGHRSVDELRDTEGKSVDGYFREVFRC